MLERVAAPNRFVEEYVDGRMRTRVGVGLMRSRC